MDVETLRKLQAPLKEQYKTDPATALQTFRSVGNLDIENFTCQIVNGTGDRPIGLHPAAGGDGSAACSGEMLLEALVGCAGVTLLAVATAMELPLESGEIEAEAEMDFRGTLGVDREVPIGLTQIRMTFKLNSTAAPEKLNKLVELTERYCVIFQTLKHPPEIRVSPAS